MVLPMACSGISGAKMSSPKRRQKEYESHKMQNSVFWT